MFILHACTFKQLPVFARWEKPENPEETLTLQRYILSVSSICPFVVVFLQNFNSRACLF